jgi:hypothetical protein
VAGAAHDADEADAGPEQRAELVDDVGGVVVGVDRVERRPRASSVTDDSIRPAAARCPGEIRSERLSTSTVA